MATGERLEPLAREGGMLMKLERRESQISSTGLCESRTETLFLANTKERDVYRMRILWNGSHVTVYPLDSARQWKMYIQ